MRYYGKILDQSTQKLHSVQPDRGQGLRPGKFKEFSVLEQEWERRADGDLYLKKAKLPGWLDEYGYYNYEDVAYRKFLLSEYNNKNGFFSKLFNKTEGEKEEFLKYDKIGEPDITFSQAQEFSDIFVHTHDQAWKLPDGSYVKVFTMPSSLENFMLQTKSYLPFQFCMKSEMFENYYHDGARSAYIMQVPHTALNTLPDGEFNSTANVQVSYIPEEFYAKTQEIPLKYVNDYYDGYPGFSFDIRVELASSDEDRFTFVLVYPLNNMNEYKNVKRIIATGNRPQYGEIPPPKAVFAPIMTAEYVAVKKKIIKDFDDGKFLWNGEHQDDFDRKKQDAS